jgi:hypothetical protein
LGRTEAQENGGFAAIPVLARTTGMRLGTKNARIASRRTDMPEKRIVEKAKKDMRRGKAATTAAGEFVHEEIEHVRQGKHGARSTKQAIAIGLSKARRAGVPLKPPRKGATSERTRKSAERAYEVGQGERKPRAPSPRRGRAVERALKREGRSAASSSALSRQAKQSARKRKSATGGKRRASR